MKIIFLKATPERLIVAALFTTYFIFGILKVFGMSPVESVVSQIVSMFGNELFFILGIIEVGLAIGLLIPKTRFIFAIFIILHLIGVSITSLLFPGFVFSPQTILTVEGQFVVKNFVLIAAAYYLVWKKISVSND